jgi:hypothetical protein
VAVFVGAGVELGGVGTLVVARGWGWDRVPARGEPGEQDAGDHKGPLPSPHHPRPYGSSVAFSLLPSLFASVDAYEGRSIGCGHDQSAPTVMEYPHRQV